MTVGSDLTICIWYDDTQDVITVRGAGQRADVNNDPASKRGNPCLYKKRATALRDAGEGFPAAVV